MMNSNSENDNDKIPYPLSYYIRGESDIKDFLNKRLSALYTIDVLQAFEVVTRSRSGDEHLVQLLYAILDRLIFGKHKFDEVNDILDSVKLAGEKIFKISTQETQHKIKDKFLDFINNFENKLTEEEKDLLKEQLDAAIESVLSFDDSNKDSTLDDPLKELKIEKNRITDDPLNGMSDEERRYVGFIEKLFSDTLVLDEENSKPSLDNMDTQLKDLKELLSNLNFDISDGNNSEKKDEEGPEESKI